MIFGFNTDITVQDTVYHVQTEWRLQEGCLESQVFVGGRCIGKRTASIAADSSEADTQEMTRAQHRWVVEAVRAGFVDEVLERRRGGADEGEPLAVHFLGSERGSDGVVRLRFRVLSGGYVASGVQVETGWKASHAQGTTESQTSDDAGVFELRLPLADEEDVELHVRAALDERAVERRFLVRSKNELAP